VKPKLNFIRGQENETKTKFISDKYRCSNSGVGVSMSSLIIDSRSVRVNAAAITHWLYQCCNAAAAAAADEPMVMMMMDRC